MNRAEMSGDPFSFGLPADWQPTPDQLRAEVEEWSVNHYPPSQRGRPDDSQRSEGMWWPAGQSIVPNSGLKWVLADSARWHARTTLANFASNNRNELLQAAISCGTAVELLVKATCASVSFSLLAKDGDRDSLLMLSGNGRITTVAATSMKSILGQDALFLAKRLHKDIPTVVERAPVFVVRNAAAHMALVDADELHQAVKQMVRIIDFLLER